MSPAKCDANSWTINEACEELEGLKMTTNPRKETLAERAKRFVGDALEHDDARDASAESAAEPTIARSSHTRRREQVLQAQRAHRQRTQGYIKALENEILRLRGREHAILRDTALLREHVSMLEQTLLANGIGIPSAPGLSGLGTPYASGTPYDMSSVAGSIPSSVPSSTGRDDPFSNLTIDLRDMQNVEAERWCSTVAAESEPRPFEVPSFDPVIWESLVRSEAASSGAGASYGAPLDDPQTGINFILELERPCLPHVKYRYLQAMPPNRPGDIPLYNAGPGHVFTATEQIVNLQRSLSPSQTRPQPQASEHWREHQGTYQQPPRQPPLDPSGHGDQPMQEAFDQPFSVPKEQIDKLLQTSSQLELHTEVTPVQIWSRISSISSHFPIGTLVLQALKEEFLKYIRCNSFGAVIEKVTATQVLAHFFPGIQFNWP